MSRNISIIRSSYFIPLMDDTGEEYAVTTRRIIDDLLSTGKILSVPKRIILYNNNGIPLLIPILPSSFRAQDSVLWTSCPNFSVLETALGQALSLEKDIFPAIIVGDKYTPLMGMQDFLPPKDDNPYRALHNLVGTAVTTEHAQGDLSPFKGYTIGTVNGDAFDVSLYVNNRFVRRSWNSVPTTPNSIIEIDGLRFRLAQVRHKSFREEPYCRLDDSERRTVVQELEADLNYDNEFTIENCPFFY